MKVLFLLLFHFLSVFVLAQNSILEGVWKNPDNTMHVEFYNTGENQWNAKIVYLKNDKDVNGEPLRDVYNSKPSLRSRKVIGIDYLYDLRLKSNETKLIGGNIYYYQNGNNYNAIVEIKDDKTLNIKGYWWFFRLLGSNSKWTKVSSTNGR